MQARLQLATAVLHAYAHCIHGAGVVAGKLAHGPCLSHQRTKLTGRCGITFAAEPLGSSTPLVQCTLTGISQGQMASSTAQGQMARGAARISAGYSPSSPTVGTVGSGCGARVSARVTLQCYDASEGAPGA